MTNAEKFLYALGMTETIGNPEAWGDHGRAFGRWQVHMDRLFNEAKRYKLEPFLNETVDSFVGRVVTAMYNHRTEEKYDALAVAQYWHLGHIAQVVEYDQEYSKRFNAYWNREIAVEPAVESPRPLEEAHQLIESMKLTIEAVVKRADRAEAMLRDIRQVFDVA